MKLNNTPITPAARIHIERGMVLHENGRKLSKFLESHGKDFLNMFFCLGYSDIKLFPKIDKCRYGITSLTLTRYFRVV